MKEQAPKILYQAYVDYGLVVVVAVAAVLVVWFLLKYIKTVHEKHRAEIKQMYEKEVMEKEKQIDELREQLKMCREEMHRIVEVMDHSNDVISENSKALYENASVVKHVEGVLVGMLNSQSKK